MSNLLKVPHSQLGVEPVLAFVQSASSFYLALDSQFRALCHVLSGIHRSLETTVAALEEFNLKWGERSIRQTHLTRGLVLLVRCKCHWRYSYRVRMRQAQQSVPEKVGL